MKRLFLSATLLVGTTFSLCAQMFLPTKVEGKWGYRDESGKMVIEPKYNGYKLLRTNSCVVLEAGNSSHVMNEKGKVLFQGESVTAKVEGAYIIVHKYPSDEASLYDLQGNLLMNWRNDLVIGGYLADNVFRVKSIAEKSFGVMNDKGEIIIPFKYKNIWQSKIDNILYCQQNDDSVDLYYTNGKELISGLQKIDFDKTSLYLFSKTEPQLVGFYFQKNDQFLKPSYFSIDSYSETSITTFQKTEEGLYGYLDKATGKEVAPCLYKIARRFNETDMLAAVSTDGKTFKYISANGSAAFSGSYTYASSFHKGLALVRTTSGVVNLIDKTGKSLKTIDLSVVPSGTVIEEATIHENLIIVSCSNDKTGMLNPQGEWLLAPNYTNSVALSDELYLVSKDIKEYRLLHTDGKLSEPLDFESYVWFNNSISKNNKVGLLNDKGEIVLPCDYKEISKLAYAGQSELFSDWHLLTDDSGKQGFFNTESKKLIPCEYSTSFPSVYANDLIDVKKSTSGEAGILHLPTGTFYSTNK